MSGVDVVRRSEPYLCLEECVKRERKERPPHEEAMWLAEQLIKPWNRRSCEFTQSMKRGLAEELSALNDGRAKQFLIECLSCSDADVRENAAWALGVMRVESAATALVNALKDEDSGVQYVAAIALGRICRDSTCNGWSKNALEVQDKYDNVTFDNVLEHPYYPLRWRAAEKMVKDPQPEWVGIFERALNDKHFAVRAWALLGLAKLLGPDALFAIEFALHDEHVGVRDAAEIALGHVSRSFDHWYSAAHWCIKCND